jgi:hypothetical protein
MVFFVEDTLRVSNVEVVNDLRGSGQLLPLLVGIATVLTVAGNWIQDRLKNKAARTLSRTETIERERGRAMHEMWRHTSTSSLGSFVSLRYE